MPEIFEFSIVSLPGQMEGMLGIETRYHVPQSPVLQASGIVLPQSLHRAVPSRQVEYLAGRACAVEACRRLGLNMTPPSTGANREPIWPAGVTGSISHSKGYALAVVSSVEVCRSLGVDLEHIVDRQKADKLFGMIANTDESECLLPLVNGNKELAFTLLFCAKEALFKATWPLVRRFINFEEATLTSCQPGRLSFDAGPLLAADLGSLQLPVIAYQTDKSTVTTFCWYDAG